MPKGTKIEGNGYERVSSSEKKERIEISAIWKLENPDAGYVDFIKWAEAKWDYRRRTATLYWNDAKTFLNETISEDSEAARKIAAASLTKMLRKALNAGDDKLALEVRKELSKVEGVYTTKIEVSQKEDLSIFKIDLDKNEHTEDVDD